MNERRTAQRLSLVKHVYIELFTQLWHGSSVVITINQFVKERPIIRRLLRQDLHFLAHKYEGVVVNFFTFWFRNVHCANNQIRISSDLPQCTNLPYPCWWTFFPQFNYTTKYNKVKQWLKYRHQTKWTQRELQFTANRFSFLTNCWS